MSSKKKSNATVLLIKNALRTVVRRMPEEEKFIEKGEIRPDCEKLSESIDKLVKPEDFKEVLNSFGVDYVKLFRRNDLDLTEGGAMDKTLPLSIIKELGYPVPESLKKVLPGRKKKSVSVYLYQDKYFVWQNKWKVKRFVLDGFAEMLTAAGYADEKWLEDKKINLDKKDYAAPEGAELRKYMKKLSESLKEREKTIKYIVIEGLGKNGYSDETGIAMSSSLYASENDICPVTSATESLFAVNSAVTKEEFEENMRINGADPDDVIYFIETGAVANTSAHTEAEEEKLTIVEELADRRIFIEKHTRDYLNAIHGGCFEPEDTVLLYGVESEGLVFMEEDDAKKLADFKSLVYGAHKRWRHFRDKYPSEFEDVMEYWEEDPDGRPRLYDYIDAEKIPGCNEGIYFDWPAADMLYLMPDELQMPPYGEIKSSWGNGNFLKLYTSMEKEIIEFLEEEGYTVIKDEDIMDWACA